MELVKIPAGSFTMGTNGSGNFFLASKPTHSVTLGYGFYLGKFEVTQAQYQAVKGTNPSYFAGNANRPVESLSWHDAVDFCIFLTAACGRTIRLPSEAEWEYACKADKGNIDTMYYFGDDDGTLLPNYAWYVADSGGETHPVGQKAPNSFGLYDMSGNVEEWCQDAWHGDYTGAPADGSVWATGGIPDDRVARGGSYDQHPENNRSAYRNDISATIGNRTRGFRVVAE